MRSSHGSVLEMTFTCILVQGFKLLRTGGRFGFIISDTFFTLQTKLRVRELLQAHQLDYRV